MINNGDPKKQRKKKDKDKEKNKEKDKEKDKDKENESANIKKKKLSKIIMEESDEDNISVKKNGSTSNGNDTNMSENGTSSNNDSIYEKKNMFKEPLLERLKKRNSKINEMPSFKLTTNFGKKIKRDFDDFSDINFDFNDKDKFF